MIISEGDKVHVVYRALYETSTRRHFLGEVIVAEGSICRLTGYVFIHDRKSDLFVRKKNPRTTIIDLAESGYIVNLLDPGVELENVVYKYISGEGVIVTDMQGFSMNVNEYGVLG